MDEAIARGEVWLVGAGPGDSELLTRKAERLLRAASVVFYDALVSADVLALTADGARKVPVGKRSGRHSKDQDSINALLVEAALAGERVVRLKGGDPSMFGRSMEEVAALAEVGVRARICPGVTAASAAAASVGISLSLRGLARRVQFVTAHARSGEPLDLDWARLADRGCTTAFYMGRSAAADISRNLIAHGLDPATPVLVACDVSLTSERCLRTRLDLLPLAVQAVTEGKPTLILVGEAVRQEDASLARKAAAQADR
ncbi:uroporphyrinogen-III C-methyltransferase [Sphingomonas psychrotolerans]|uniref:uroporphyrinogen-III C-methyltransferase n=1 Tax=Sphingomonas psychrotolerans TaxID=1327635 RepID=A0ABU3MZ78_9SPHN|nr:uroporphyrinogen-III C-methyltransferase [Sphingomonas psychrotolerans]MDT8757590.1 uroporphyrinogen-III C-methyltransferase [Sphingomonas psychrotolerans]